MSPFTVPADIEKFPFPPIPTFPWIREAPVRVLFVSFKSPLVSTVKRLKSPFGCPIKPIVLILPSGFVVSDARTHGVASAHANAMTTAKGLKGLRIYNQQILNQI